MPPMGKDMYGDRVARRRVDHIAGKTTDRAGSSDAVRTEKVVAGRKDGGAVNRAAGGAITGSNTKARADRPSRARGGVIRKQFGGELERGPASGLEKLRAAGIGVPPSPSLPPGMPGKMPHPPGVTPLGFENVPYGTPVFQGGPTPGSFGAGWSPVAPPSAVLPFKKGGAVKRANGGKVGKKKGSTTVNVIIQEKEDKPPMPLPLPVPAGPPPGLAGPPPGLPPGGPPMAGPPGPPRPPMGPPIPPRAMGGRTYKQGGKVIDRDANMDAKAKVTQTPTDGTKPLQAAISEGTKISHRENKNDAPNVEKRGKPVTYKTGGPVNAPPGKKGMAPHMPGGGHGGAARLAKAHRAARTYKKA